MSIRQLTVAHTFKLKVLCRRHLSPKEYLCVIDETKRFWAADEGVLEQKYIVGDKLDMLPLDEPHPFHGWEDVRLAILDYLYLNDSPKQQVSDSTACTCSSHAIFLYGCPSVKGKPCPSRK